MTRSRRKHPFIGFCTCESEREDKQRAHRAERHAIQQRLRVAPEAEAPLPHWYQFSDPWAWGKDGKMRFSPLDGRMRKLLRK